MRIMNRRGRKGAEGRLRVLCGEFLRIVQLALFRSCCRGCGNDLVFSSEHVVCSDCLETIQMDNQPACPICGRHMADWFDRCGECMIQQPPFRKHTSYSRYDDLLKELILAYKYGGIQTLKHLFADYYTVLFQERIAGSFDYIVPVPPDKSRNREFAHMLEICKIAARRLGIPLLSGQLIKIKKTLPQAGLTRAKRLKNLDGAFKLKDPAKLKGKKVLLIDDVYTTGTTIGKCAQLLTRADADVVALTLARS
jgi:ComF family protein